MCDENSYFVDAKRIRVSVRNKESNLIEKKEVTVHLECLKQLELLKQKSKVDPLLGKRPAEEPLPNESQEKKVKSVEERQEFQSNIKSLMQGIEG